MRVSAEEARLVERVGRVGDELAQEDFFVRVERVDDQREDLLDLRLEGELDRAACWTGSPLFSSVGVVSMTGFLHQPTRTYQEHRVLERSDLLLEIGLDAPHESGVVLESLA